MKILKTVRDSYSKDFVVFPGSRHFLYSKDFVISPVSRHILSNEIWTLQHQMLIYGQVEKPVSACKSGKVGVAYK